MSTFENPKHGEKWLCEKCHTWCVPEVPRCSWCGGKKPQAKATQAKTKKENA